MVTYLPGLGDELAPAISQIGQAVTKVLDPDREFRELLKLSIAQDPKVLKTLADISINSPGLFGMLGADAKTVDAIRAAGPSQQAKEEKALGDKSIETKAKGLELDATMTDNLIKALQGDSVARDAALKQLTGQTEAGRKIEGAQATIAEGQADLVPLETETRKMDLELQRKNILQLMSIPEMQEPVNLSGIVDSFRNGTTDPKVMAQLHQSPGMMEALQWTARFKEQQEDRMMRQAAGADELTRSKIIAARARYRDTGVGSTEAWVIYDDPERQDMIDEALAKPPAERSLLENDLLAIHNAQRAERGQNQQARLSQFSTNLSHHINNYRQMREESGVKDENLTPVINAMQASLDANQDILGGQRIIVAPQRKGDKVKDGKFIPGDGKVRGNKLVYYTEDGTVVPEGAIQTGTVPTFTSSAPTAETSGPNLNTPDAQQVIAAHLKMYYEIQDEGDKAAWLEGLMRNSPTTYRAVKEALNKR